MFSAISKFIGSFVGTDTAIKETSHTLNNVFDTVSTGIGKSFFTSQERAEMGLKTGEMVIESEKLRIEALKILWTNNNKGSALSRRIIAVSFTWSYLILIFLAVGYHGFGAITKAEFVFKVVELTLVTPIIAILGYYFLHGVSNQVTKTIGMFKKDKKKKE